jgi:hypothetical protein
MISSIHEEKVEFRSHLKKRGENRKALRVGKRKKMATINETNITVNVNNFQSSYTALGLGPVPPGTTADLACTTIETQLKKNLVTNWNPAAPPLDPTQVDTAIMQPYTAVVAGTAPPCVVQQLNLDFSNWALPVVNTLFTSIAMEITMGIVNQGGLTGGFSGKTVIAGSEVIYWSVAYTTAVVIDNPSTVGVIYAFGAVLSA